MTTTAPAVVVVAEISDRKFLVSFSGTNIWDLLHLERLGGRHGQRHASCWHLLEIQAEGSTALAATLTMLGLAVTAAAVAAW